MKKESLEMTEDLKLQVRIFESRHSTTADEASIEENCYLELAEILKAADADQAIAIKPATLLKVEQKMKEQQRLKTMYKKAISVLIFILVLALSLQFLWQTEYSWRLFSQMILTSIPFLILIASGWLIEKKLKQPINQIMP